MGFQYYPRKYKIVINGILFEQSWFHSMNYGFVYLRLIPDVSVRAQCHCIVTCNSLGNHQRSRIPTMPHLHPFTWDCPSWGMRSIDCALKKNSANIQYLYLFSEVVCLINELEWTNRWQMYLDEYSVSIRLQMITSTRKKII